jgi:hypothetical protein
MRPGRVVASGVHLALLALGASAAAAQVLPLAPAPAQGLPISPYYEGWYRNSDGTFTISFGYFNRNGKAGAYVPLGPDNYIEPAEYDGVQPTHFPVGRQQGVFTVTVPASFTPEDRIVWTIRSAGQTYSVPGKIEVEGYQLAHRPMAMGSRPPSLRLEPAGPELLGPMSFEDNSPPAPSDGGAGSITDPLTMTAGVGTPLTLTVWGADRFDGEEREPVPVGVSWFTHRGPSAVVFGESELEADSGLGGWAETTAEFTLPGEYLLRVRADNFNPLDSSLGDQCCWTNGYLRVTVSP